MVEFKESILDQYESPPLVPAHLIPDLHTLEPIGIHVVTIDGDLLLPEASFVGVDSVEPIIPDDDGTTPAKTHTWSAGIAGGVLGTLVGGPLLGIAAGGAAAYFAGKEGVGGDTARAMADVARTTGQKAQELNEKHKLIDKSKQAAGSAWKKVQELDRKHDLAKKGKEAATSAWEGAKELNRKHGILEKLGAFAVFCFQRFAQFLADISERMVEDAPPATATKVPQEAATCY